MHGEAVTSNLVLTLGGGALLALAAFLLLYRLTRLAGKQIGLLVALGGTLLYAPFAVLRWQGLDVLAIHLALYWVIPYGLGIIATHREGHRELHEGKRWFQWAPTVIVGFLGVVAVVDAVIISFAENGVPPELAARILPAVGGGVQVHSAFPGMVAQDYQARTENYAAYQRRLQAQKALGWQVRKGFIDPPRAGHDAVFQLELRDRAGRPLVEAAVTGSFMRPSNAGEDQRFVMREVRPGQYRAVIRLPRPGNWELLLDIRRGDALYEVRGLTQAGG
ncbi:MAG: FixH family protein [Acidihalobacter sp.]